MVEKYKREPSQYEKGTPEAFCNAVRLVYGRTIGRTAREGGLKTLAGVRRVLYCLVANGRPLGIGLLRAQLLYSRGHIAEL